MKNIYLDYAAATPLSPVVLEAMQPYFAEKFYNPSATYLAARAVKADLEEARANVAQVVGAKPAEIVFTAGASEANNLAIAGVMSKNPGGEVLVSAIEHDSVLTPAKKYGAKLIPVDQSGVVDSQGLTKLISDKTILISVMLVNNELGTIQPIREIAKLVERVRAERRSGTPLYLHVDAAQAANWLDLHVSRLGVDLLTISGAKIYGPKQTGVLYVRAGVELEPLVLGGGQESGSRAGTENVAGFIGLAKALEVAQNNRAENVKKIGELRRSFIDQLGKTLPNVQINGPAKSTAPHIANVTFAGVDNEKLMMQLDETGVQVGLGSACSASSDEPSHVLKAIGLNDKQARSTLRFSFGRYTAQAEIDEAVEILKKLLE